MGLRSIKRKEDFNPVFIGLFINPFYIARRGLYKGIQRLAPEIDGRVLDVGCGRKPYRSLFTCKEYIGLDIENPGHSHENEDVDVFYDGKVFPFENASFNNALCNQVLEHVFNPDEFLSEINRVLQPGGKLLLTVPFAWDEHEQPYDYARYSSFGLKHLMEKHGFSIETHLKSVNDSRAICQLWNTFLYKKLLTGSGLLNLLTTFLFMSPMNVLSLIWGPLFGKSRDFYLDNIILAVKK
ncbi:MAG: methyltransferase domain-containing protein [Bacteroidetes bacterium]|nr:methyltransferase domain-containing protein [Bacteroidota bacterium]